VDGTTASVLDVRVGETALGLPVFMASQLWLFILSKRYEIPSTIDLRWKNVIKRYAITRYCHLAHSFPAIEMEIERTISEPARHGKCCLKLEYSNIPKALFTRNYRGHCCTNAILGPFLY
jgi:hypothetical protein